MLYGELGRFPVSLIIKRRMLKFWYKLVTDTGNKLSTFMYKTMLDDVASGFCLIIG